MTTALQIDGLRIAFGGIVAVNDMKLAVAPGAIHALIGPNGAGKTTVLNCISRFYDADAGSIRFEGRELTKLRDHRIAALGIARTFQNLELFGDLSVLDNVRIARHRFQRATLLEVLWNLGRKRREDAEHRERAALLAGRVGGLGLGERKVEDRHGNLPEGTAAGKV